MSTESTQEILLALAEEKLSLLNAYYIDLRRYIEQDELTAEEITSAFEQLQDCMDRIRKNDRLYADAATNSGVLRPQESPTETTAIFSVYSEQNRLSALLEDQRTLARSISVLVGEAYEKSERLARNCRTGLRGVQQQKWILTQFAERPLEPGSLLNYSEKLHTRPKEK